jgi:uncharacterized membrane protein
MRKTLEVAGLLAFALLVWITWSALYGPSCLPDRVPTHFDAAGNPNGWGPPSGMLFMPLIAGLLYLLMSVVTRFPHSFHYPVRATAANIGRLQSVTIDMIAWLKLELACLFLTLQWAFVQSAHSGNGRIFPMILPVSILVIFGTIGAHLLVLFRIAGSARRA